MSEVGTSTRLFDGVYNFRDIGGLPAGEGRRTRRGVLYRSDAFIDASPGDVDHVVLTLGIRRVVDLRAARESDADSASAWIAAGVETQFLPVDRGPGKAIEAREEGDRLSYRYMEYLIDASDSFVAVVRDFVGPAPVPTIVHCRVGKDRTGVALAVLLGLAGVPAPAIAADYAVTSAAMPKLLERLAASDVYRENVSKLPPEMYSAEASTMVRFLELVDERFGGMAEWARVQGFTDDERQQVRENLTEPIG